MNSWQKYVKAHMSEGRTFKDLAESYRSKQHAGQPTQKQQKQQKQQKDEPTLKITGKYKCNGDCDSHVAQLNVYIRYLQTVLSDDILKADNISDTEQIVIFCNILLINLISYHFNKVEEDTENALTVEASSKSNSKKRPSHLTKTGIEKALVIGNDKATEPETLAFRTSFFKWMGSDEYAELLNSIDLGCAVNTTADMKDDYIIKVASMAYGLQTLFAESDLNEVHNYKTALWFNDFIKEFKRKTIAISDDCMPHVSATRKGLKMLASAARLAYSTGKAAGKAAGKAVVYAAPHLGKAAVATGKAAVYAAPHLGKAAVATGKGLIYAAPIAGKAAWYTGEKAWYTTEATAKFVGRLPVVGPVAKHSVYLTLQILDLLAEIGKVLSGTKNYY